MACNRPLVLALLISSLLLIGCRPERVAEPVVLSTTTDAATATAAAELSSKTPAATDEPSAEEATLEEAPPVPAAPEASQPTEEATGEPKAEEELDLHPFPRRVEMPPLPVGPTWLNTSAPLTLEELRGKFVLLDFWTYCCINCLHVLPELQQLEEKYPNELVVIGVHSAKFETEQETQNIKEAILRYNVHHPVINDNNHLVWDTYGVSSWPTLVLIDPEGNAVWANSGETKFETLDAILSHGLPYYREHNLLDETPLHFDLLAHQEEPTPLRFPGKVLADEDGNRLFITDTNHHRIVVTDLTGKLLTTIGSGAKGRNDGNYQQATFNQPHGVALHGDLLYVADTKNHLIRKVNLKQENVQTIAGTGEQGRGWPGMAKLSPYEPPLPERWVGPPLETGLSSPWALLVEGEVLYIAMAGPHQIWSMPLNESEIGLYAGNGREDIVDGPLMPETPYEQGIASFAQPSGLASDGTWLYVADSEGSSIRAVPFDPEQEVRTVVGTNHLAAGRLFTFGDVDGPKQDVLLQHVLGVSYHEGKIYAADTYNNKIKVVDAETGETQTLAGTREPGLKDGPAETAQFDEPAGLSYAAGKVYVADTNNHAIRVIELASKEVTTLEIAGLESAAEPKKPAHPSFAAAPRVRLEPQAVKPVEGKITLQTNLVLPGGWKINPLGPMGYLVEASAENQIIQPSKLGEFIKPEVPSTRVNMEVPVSGEGQAAVDVSLVYYYCTEGATGICKVGSVVWEVPLNVSAEAEATTAILPLNVRP